MTLTSTYSPEDATQNTPATQVLTECQNCATIRPERDLNEIQNYDQRVEPGESIPVGECPDCGALCHPTKSKFDATTIDPAQQRHYDEYQRDPGHGAHGTCSDCRIVAGLPTLPPDPEDQNPERAAAAKRALDAFARDCGEVYECDTPDETRELAEQNLSDLLCNLAHYCDRIGLKMADCLRRAAMHYGEESDNEGTQSFSFADSTETWKELTDAPSTPPRATATTTATTKAS